MQIKGYQTEQSDNYYLESFSRTTNFFPRPHSLCPKLSNAEKSINGTKLENVDRLNPLFLSSFQASSDNMVYNPFFNLDPTIIISTKA